VLDCTFGVYCFSKNSLVVAKSRLRYRSEALQCIFSCLSIGVSFGSGCCELDECSAGMFAGMFLRFGCVVFTVPRRPPGDISCLERRAGRGDGPVQRGLTFTSSETLPTSLNSISLFLAHLWCGAELRRSMGAVHRLCEQDGGLCSYRELSLFGYGRVFLCSGVEIVDIWRTGLHNILVLSLSTN
jgi:hypothetical protein